MNYDIFLVGVGGQGILTIGEILAGVAQMRAIPVNFFPSKGMAQRGGFVKAQLRLGRAMVGPNIGERGADLVLAMEVSEALKAVRYAKEGGDFVLFGDVWAPTAVMLGKAAYPTLDQVREQVLAGGARLCYIDPQSVPSYQQERSPDNIFMLGAALKCTRLGQLFSPEDVRQVIQTRWKRMVEANLFAFQAGLDFTGEALEEIAPKG